MTENMADQTNEAAEGQMTDQQTQDQQDQQDTERTRGNAEAAKYRRQLREVETERDNALAELDSLKREKIMQDYDIKERHLKLLNTTGTVEEFEQSVKNYREVHNPYVVRESGSGVLQGGGSGSSPNWSDAIKG